jgi:threonine synthase
MTTARLARWPGVIEAYRDRMPVRAGWRIVTLGEGGTPLLPAPHLSGRTGCEVFLKVDGANPTGSFKDRGMTVAVTDALADGKQGVLCASTGNTSASAAAYAARAGMSCAVLVLGRIALGWLARASRTARGSCRSTATDDLELARKTRAGLPGRALVSSINPAHRGRPVRVQDLRRARPRPGHPLPVGNAGNITYWAGYRRTPRTRRDRRTAADVRLQAAGAALGTARRCGTPRRSRP